MTDKIKVWDPAIRLFHWSLVISFTISYVVSDDDVRLHAKAGYVVFGLLLFRILWGFVGGRFARFSEFIRGPMTTLSYLRSLFSSSAKRYVGHNPAGGWMIVLLLVSLFVTSWSGLMIYAQEGKGPLAVKELRFITGVNDQRSRERDREHDPIYELHDFFGDFSLLLALIHIGGVVVSSRLHRENLVKAMVTGRKAQHSDQ
jgi:cytochrome b